MDIDYWWRWAEPRKQEPMIGEKTFKRAMRAALNAEREKYVDALNKIHDLAGQISGPGAHPNLGAIQDWCHKVLGPCDKATTTS